MAFFISYLNHSIYRQVIKIIITIAFSKIAINRIFEYKIVLIITATLHATEIDLCGCDRHRLCYYQQISRRFMLYFVE